MLFLGQHGVTGRHIPKIEFEIPRDALRTTATRTKRVMLAPTLVAEFALAGSDRGLTLQFPMPCRAAGAQLAEALEGDGSSQD